MEPKDILEAVKQARAGSKERKFKQTFDLAINFKDLDLTKPAHKIKDSIVLPHGRGKSIKIAAIADGVIAESAKKAGITKILDKPALGKLGTNKREAKKLAKEFDFFIAQTDFMVDVGKHLGAILGPRNKMPQPVPPNAPLEAIIKRFEKLVNVRIVNDQIIHCRVGTEEMSDDQLAANINTVLTAISRKAPKHEANIRSAYVKTTMGKSVRIGGAVAQKVEGGKVEGSKKERKPKAQSLTPNASEPVEPVEGGEEQ